MIAVNLFWLPSTPLYEPLAPVPAGNFSAVYFVMDDRRVLYIGQSTKLRARLRQHAHTGSFPPTSCVRWLAVDVGYLSYIERLMLMAYQPAFNKNYPYKIHTPPRDDLLPFKGGYWVEGDVTP